MEGINGESQPRTTLVGALTSELISLNPKWNEQVLITCYYLNQRDHIILQWQNWEIFNISKNKVTKAKLSSLVEKVKLHFHTAKL